MYFPDLGTNQLISNQLVLDPAKWVTATDARPLIWQFDFLDDGMGNKRITGGLRDVGGSAPGNQAFFEMGRYNDVFDPETGSIVAGYAVRTMFAGGLADENGWIDFPGKPSVKAGWHHFSATIGATYANFSLDLNEDGTVDYIRRISISAAGRQYNTLRFGGPSDVSSAGGGGYFDNLSLSLGNPVPLPSAFAGGGALLLGAGALRLRRKVIR